MRLPRSEQGYDFIEIPLLKPHEFDPEVHKQALARAGIYATASLVLPDDAHMPAHPERAMESLISAVGKSLKPSTVTIWLCGCIAYSLGLFTGAPPTYAERQVVIEVLGEVAADAKKRGITLGLEAVSRHEGYMYNALADAHATILAIGADNIQRHADTCHMNVEEEGYYKPLVECADVLGYIHISESHRGRLGTGTINWDGVFRGLADAHYKGPLVLEAFTSINPELIAATRLWRPPKDAPDVLRAKGLFSCNKAQAVGLP